MKSLQSKLLFALLIVALTVLSQFIHEAGHATILLLSGAQPTWEFTRLVQVDSTATLLQPTQWTKPAQIGNIEFSWLRVTHFPESHFTQGVFNIAGPLATLFLGLILLIYASINKRVQIKLFCSQFAFVTLFPYSLYIIRRLLNYTGDEYQAAVSFGFPPVLVLVPFALCSITMIICSIKILIQQKRSHLLIPIVLLSMLTGLLLNYADTFITQQILAENPFFIPIAGFSFPVLLSNIVAGIVVFTVLQMSLRTRTTSDT